MMERMNSGDGAVDVAAMWKELAALEAGELEPSRRDELMRRVARSPAAQRVYLDYFEVSAAIEAEARTHAEQGMLPVVDGERGEAKRIFRRSVLAAAAVLLFAAMVAALFTVRSPSQKGLLAASTAGARWMVDGKWVEPDTEPTVGKGAVVRVDSGVVRLASEGGASMVIQGPALVSFPTLNRPALHKGWLWIDSGESDEALVVETSELLVRDIGTRFGIRVPEKGVAEVHLVHGKLEIDRKDTGERVASLEPEERGLKVPATGEPEILDLAMDPFHGLDELLEAPKSYEATMRGQSPSGYWRMTAGDSGSLANEVEEGHSGALAGEAAVGASGARPEAGFPGFGDNNTSIGVAGGTSILLGQATVHDGLLFREDFGANGDDLHGSVPKVSFEGEKWVAGKEFNRDGTIEKGRSGASLAFSPVAGVRYTLDATVTTTWGPSRDWVALGFGRAQTARPVLFDTQGLSGRVWMLHRAADTTKPVNRAWLGADVRDWEWSSGSPLGGTMDMRIVLDTTGGAGAWTATWYAKRPGEQEYVMVRPTERLINESIGSVGLSVFGTQLSASIESFSLRAEPEIPVRSELPVAGGPTRLTLEEGAVAFWFRREAGAKGPEVLWTAGEGALDHSVHQHLTADGRVGFFMENGRYDVLIASEDPLDDGGWHHLVASWSPSSVKLYIDGRLAAADVEYRGRQQGSLPDLRFAGEARGLDFGTFSGWIDEVGVWDRALTATEVEHQFKSAKGE